MNEFESSEHPTPARGGAAAGAGAESCAELGSSTGAGPVDGHGPVADDFSEPATGARRHAALDVELARTRRAHDALMFELGLRAAVGDDDETFRIAVDEIRAQERLMAAAQAKRAELLAFVCDATAGHTRSRSPGDDDALAWAMRERTSELAVATSQPEGRISSELADAVLLHESFPETANEFHRGGLSQAHVRAITGPGARIPTRRARAEYERALLGPAHRLTPARLRARAAQLAEQHLPESIDQRHAHAAAARGVHVRHEHDGMSRLEADLPTVLAAAIHNRLTAQARALAGPDEPRTHHQLRADVFSELLLTSDLACTGSPHAAAAGIAARISITVPVLSLLDHTTAPALLDGLTPIPLEQARALTAHAPSWLRVLTDPITGTTREVDTRHPTAAQRALLHARDHHCRFPGCTRPAPQCDIDHTVAVVDGGATRIDNMEHLCRRHHTLKHHTRWRVRQHPGGHLDWTSPTGHTYTDNPTPTTTHIRRADLDSDEPPPHSSPGQPHIAHNAAAPMRRPTERAPDPGREAERERGRTQQRAPVPEPGSPPGRAFGVRPTPVFGAAALGTVLGSDLGIGAEAGTGLGAGTRTGSGAGTGTGAGAGTGAGTGARSGPGPGMRHAARGHRARRAGPRFEPSDEPPPF